MTAPRLTSIVSDRTDIELAAALECVWRARDYQTRVHLHGSDVHVDAVGKTLEGVEREIQIRMMSTGTVTTDKTSTFVQWCERVGIEPYVATVGGDRAVPDARRPGLVVLDTPAIAVEIREVGVESFVRDLAAERDGASDGEGGSLDSEGDDDDAEDPEDDETGENDVADRLTRRGALTKAGIYVADDLVTYLAVECVSDVVQQLSELRVAVVCRTAWPDAHLPNVRLPSVRWSAPAPQPLSEESILPNRTTVVSMLANATTTPYTDLRGHPETYTGTAITYTDRVGETTECDKVRLMLVVVKDDRGRLSGNVVACWPAGQLFDSDIDFRLLVDERVRLWGAVAGEGSISGGARYPRVDVSALEKT